MASLGVLSDDLAAALGLPVASVAAYAKVLREAKIIQTSGRGTSAAKMTTDDGAALLTAILASRTIAEASEYAKKGLALPFRGSDVVRFEIEGEDQVLPSAIVRQSPLNVRPPFIFEDAITGLIASARCFWVEHNALESSTELVHDGFWTRELVEVSFAAPGPVAIVTERIDEFAARRHFFGLAPYTAPRNGDILALASRHSGVDFTQAKRVGSKVIMAIAASLEVPVKTTRIRRA